MAFKLLSKTVTTAGTRVPLSTTSLVVAQAYVEAKVANTGLIYVGDVAVTSTLCKRLEIPVSGEMLPSVSLAPTADLLDLKDIYIDSSVNAEGVNVLYEEAV